MINKSLVNGRLRKMIASDLESILKIRNHPEVRRYMLTQREISIEEHTLWFNKATKDQSIRLFIFEIDKVCMGFVQLRKICNSGVANWGFYVSPDAPRGAGRKLGKAALFKAFEEENLYKIYGQVLDYNLQSIKFHKALGFTQEEILQKQYCIDKNYHDLICFSLIKSEWSKFKM